MARTVVQIDTPLTHRGSPGVLYKKGTGWIYFIRSGDAIKIGYAIDVANRFSNLQSSNPVLLELLGAIRGSIEDEHRTHAMFIRLHIRGEWFRDHPAILEYIAASDYQQTKIRKYGSAKLANLVPLDKNLEKILMERIKELRS